MLIKQPLKRFFAKLEDDRFKHAQEEAAIMKKIRHQYGLLLLLLLIMGGCRAAPQQKTAQAPVIGFSQSGTESSWRKFHTKSIKSELKKANYEVLYRNGYLNQERQIQDVRKFIAYKVDLILIAPLTENGWEPVLKEARKAKIPVIIVDRHLDVSNQNLYLTHIGSSFKAEGNRAGLFVSNHFAKSKKKQINILEVTGPLNASPSKLRQAGFSETINQDPRLRIIATLDGDFTRARGAEVMTDYEQHHDLSQLDVIFSQSDEMTLGILNALAKTTYRPGKDIIIVTVDGQKNIIAKLQTGAVNYVVECNPDAGWYVVNAMNRYFAGHELPHEIYIPETSFSESSVDNIPTRNY